MTGAKGESDCVVEYTSEVAQRVVQKMADFVGKGESWIGPMSRQFDTFWFAVSWHISCESMPVLRGCNPDDWQVKRLIVPIYRTPVQISDLPGGETETEITPDAQLPLSLETAACGDVASGSDFRI